MQLGELWEFVRSAKGGVRAHSADFCSKNPLPISNFADVSLGGVIIAFARTFFQKKLNEWVPRACYARLCDTQFLQRRKARHAIRAKRLKYQEVSRSVKWARFCETILREEWFAKPRLMFLKFGGDFVSAPQEGAGGMRDGVLVKKFIIRMGKEKST